MLNHINDTLHSAGRDINEFELISEIINASSLANEAKDVYFKETLLLVKKICCYKTN